MNKSKREFLKLLEDCKKIEEQLKLKAWEITPNDIKECLCGERGLFAKNITMALKWLIQPKWQLNDRSPVEAIIEGESEKVKKLIESYDYNIDS